MNRFIMLAFAVSLGVPATARADDLSCLRSLAEATIRWDRDWQADGADDGVRYQVESVRGGTGPGGQEQMQIAFRALEPAQKTSRTAHVMREHVAKLICDRLVTSSSTSAMLAKRTNAEHLAEFRRVHQTSIDSLVNRQIPKSMELKRSRYLAAIERDDLDEAARVLRETEAAGVPRSTAP